MKQDEEQWAKEVMQSLEGLQRAEPSPFLYKRILSGIKESAAYEVSPVTVWLAAASFALILLLNVRAIKNAGGNTRSEQQELRELALQYQLINTNNTLYN